MPGVLLHNRPMFAATPLVFGRQSLRSVVLLSSTWRRAVRFTTVCACLVLLGARLGFAQTAPPADFASKGISAMPFASSELKLELPSFTKSASIQVGLTSSLMDVQRVLVYTYSDRSMASAELAVDIKPDASNGLMLSFPLRVATGATGVLVVVQTSSGWLRTEGVIHRGRAV